jgi:RNA polymerase sigma factor (sigma-70 family)
MAGRQAAVLATIRQLLDSGPVAGLDDGQLLERFATRKDEAAFAALMALHGPMVLGVCRRILPDGHDIEDAFQATFLVLVRRAGSLRDPRRLGPWLYGVARRVALRARAEAARRRLHQARSEQARISEEPTMSPASQAEGEDVLEVIDEEIDRLPARYREAVVLCDLEGRSYVEAARRLRCPLGTLQSRLARGRARLRTRLVWRGVAPTALAAILADPARAAVPEALAEATIRAVTTGAASTTAVALAGQVSRGLVVSVVKTVTGTLILASIVLGWGPVAHERLGAEPPASDPRGAPDIAQPHTDKPDRSLGLVVVDRENDAALSGATVWVRANGGRSRDSRSTTDEEGRCTIKLPGGTLSMVQVVVIHPGFAPIELRWFREEPIPDSYTLALERGVPIGGTVSDEQGRPIARARVHLEVRATPPRGGPERYPGPDSEVAAAITDDRGRWRAEALPASAGPGVRLELVTTHPDHVGLKQSVTAEALRAFEAAGVMKPGRSLSGTILGPTGRPVAGATVIVGSRYSGKEIQTIQTDPEGRFRTGTLIDPTWQEFTMAVRADGFAWTSQFLLVPPEVPPQVVRLSPRKPLHGRVLDARGRPISGAIVRSPAEFGYAGLEWEAETDADGRFVWYEAPATGSYLLNVNKRPFRPSVALVIPGGSDDLTVTLHRQQRIHGRVSDSETGRPIERFNLIKAQGPFHPGLEPEWWGASPHPFGGGRFDLIEDYPDQNSYHSIRIEAEGYEPAELVGYHDSQEDVGHDFKLRKAATLAGIVRGPDGRPMAGVDVLIAWWGGGTSIENGRLQPASDRDRAVRTRTGPDGRYAFHPPAQGVSVMAVHDLGFALRSPEQLSASTNVTLRPWGRIEGVVKIGREPAAGQTVFGWLLMSPYSPSVSYKTQSDGSGRFVLDRVAPGRMILHRRADNQDRQGWTFSGQVNLDVRPGGTLHVQIGGTGRPVIGRLAIPEGTKLSYFALGHGALTPVLREPPYPIDYDYSRDRRAAWWDDFSRTPEGLAYLHDRDRSYAVDLRPDGTFRAEDVPAGRYVLKLPFEGVSRSSREGRQAFAHTDVTVPEIPGVRSDEPFDIGAVSLEVFPFHEPLVGEPAPVIAAKLPDGRPLDLAALRGKFVLLHFWSGRPEIAATVPHLKATHETFGRDPRFVMIGLYGGETPDPLRRYAARHGLTWEQRYIGDTDDLNPFEASFGVWFPPAAFLIGPNGRIIAKDLQGEAITQAVAKALQ